MTMFRSSFWFTTIISIICRIPFLQTHLRQCHNDDDNNDDIAPTMMTPTASPSPIMIEPSPPTNERYDPTQPLNILILYGDDWRYNSIGIMNPLLQTPTLDALAQNGIHFVNSYVTTSVCWVSRATYFTGQYMSRHQTTRVADPKFYQHWNTTSWPALLQQSEHQYYVGHIGKWQFQNPKQIVQSFFNFTSIFEYHVNAQTGIRFTEQTINDTIRFLDAYTQVNHETTATNTNRTTKKKKHPFVLNLAMFPPKAVLDGTIPSLNYRTRDLEYNVYRNTSIPIVTNNINDTSFHQLPYFLQSTTPPTESRRRYEQKYIPNTSYQENMQRYYALITEVDTTLQSIIDLLKARQLYYNTVILFTTDNGYMHGEHGLSGKWYPYQESIRVPLIVADPRMTPSQRNTKNHHFVMNIDLAPTILSIGNVTLPNRNSSSNNNNSSSNSNSLPTPQQMQGMDMTQLYLPQKNTATTNNSTIPWRDNELYYEHPTIQNRNFLTASTALISLQYSYMVYPEWNDYEVLHDLIRDPLEQINVINYTNYSTIVQYYRQRHALWKEAVK